MEDVNAVYADGKMTFTVAHFSNYVIVDETVVKDNDNSNTGDDNQNNGNQNGGNQNNGGQNNGDQSGATQNNGGQNNADQNSNNQINSQTGGAVSDNTDTAENADASADVLDEKAREYEALQSNVENAARRGYIDLIINPADTRKYLIAGFEMLFTKREERPSKKHGTI